MPTQTLSIIVPAYNEEEGISEFLEHVSKVNFPFSDFEIIVVDDGSKDSTPNIVRSIEANNAHVKLVQLSRNSGHMAALTAGFNAANGDWVVTIDADGQDDPALIPDMYQQCLNTESEICYMQRANRKNDPLRHRLFSPLFYKFISSFTAGTAPYQAADFRLITRRVVDVLNSLPEANRVYRVLIPALGFRSTSLTYERKSRTKGQSKYGFRQLANLGLKSLMATSGAPLRWLGITSIFGALIGLIISLIAIINGIFVHNIPGWSSLALLISTLFIFQSITSFVICEFLLVILADLRQRPIYQIKAKP